jgi:hypothetical protein
LTESIGRTHPLDSARPPGGGAHAGIHPAAGGRAFLELRDLSFDTVEMQVDLPLVVAAEPDPENHVVDVL